MFRNSLLVFVTLGLTYFLFFNAFKTVSLPEQIQDLGFLKIYALADNENGQSVILSEDQFNTVQVTIDNNDMTLDDIKLTGEMNPDLSLSFPNFAPENFKTLPQDYGSTTIKNARLDLLSSGIGGVTIVLNATLINEPDQRRYAIQGDIQSRQQPLVLDGNFYGTMSYDLSEFNITLNIKDFRLRAFPFDISRLQGEVQAKKSKARGGWMVSSLTATAGLFNLGPWTWQNAQFNLQIPSDRKNAAITLKANALHDPFIILNALITPLAGQLQGRINFPDRGSLNTFVNSEFQLKKQEQKRGLPSDPSHYKLSFKTRKKMEKTGLVMDAAISQNNQINERGLIFMTKDDVTFAKNP